MSEDDEIPDRIVHVADNVDEFVERTRLQQIHDAKQAAASGLREARLEASRGDAAQAAEYARGAVEAYILECEALYKQTEFGRVLWDEAPLGRLSLSEVAPQLGLDSEDVTRIIDIDVQTRGGLPVDIHRENGAPRSSSPPKRRREIDGATVTVEGVGTYVDGLTGHVTAAVEENVRSGRANSIEETTRTADLLTPVWLSREAYRATNALLGESDIGVKLLDEEEGEAEFDTSYRDESDDE